MSADDLQMIAVNFPEAAMKSQMGIGGLSMIQAYEKYKDALLSIGEIRIWSMDQHLSAYEENMVMKTRRK